MSELLNVFSGVKETTHNETTNVVRLIRNGEINAKIATYNYAFLEPGGRVEEHVHDDCIEYFFILSGLGTIYLNEESRHVKKGDFIQIDATIRHSLENTGEDLFEFLTLRAILDI